MRNWRSRKPHNTLMHGIPQLRAVSISTSLSPIYTAVSAGISSCRSAVSYGLNISTAARSISHRVKDEVEQATGLKVARVVVSVDDVIA